MFYHSFKILINVLFIFAVIYIFLNFSSVQSFLQTNFDRYFTISACDTPVYYKIGKVDPRFGLSINDFTADASQAAQIWRNVEGGKKLLVNDPADKQALTVNLLYDQRSSLRNQINQLEGQVSQKDQSLQSNIQSYEQQVADFKSKLADFNEKADQLNQEINSWNQRGGMPPDIYQQLKAQQDSLIQEQNNLRDQANSLNQMAKELNISTQDYNNQVGKLNNTISTFSNALSQQPEEGLFDPQANSINIYFDNNQDELIHTLAHEMGHALGLEHNPNFKSIMYPYSTQVIIPSTNDIDSLNQVCSIRYPKVPFLNSLIHRINLSIQI